MTEYYVHMSTDDRLPCFFPRFMYCCEYDNGDEMND